MAYPAKTSFTAIRRAALDLLEREGENALTVRGVAAALGLAPNALYRYYAGHDALLAAVADEGTETLRHVLERAAQRAVRRAGHPPAREPAEAPAVPADAAAEAVRAVARAYLAFARARPALYGVMMTGYDVPAGTPAAHEASWAFVVALLTPLTGAADAPAAGVALWAFLHGMAGLDRAGVLGGVKPRSAAAFGVEAFLAGLGARDALNTEQPSAARYTGQRTS